MRSLINPRRTRVSPFTRQLWVGRSPIWEVQAKEPPHPSCPCAGSARCTPAQAVPTGPTPPACRLWAACPLEQNAASALFSLLLPAFLFFRIHHLAVGAGWGDVAGWLHWPRQAVYSGPLPLEVSLLFHPLLSSSSGPFPPVTFPGIIKT